jgi:cbb3-type cytochrome oxidase subunit 3
MTKEQMKWISKYISRPLLVLIVVLGIVDYFVDAIDLKAFFKGSFYFFLIKGIIWLFIFAFYGYQYIINRKQNKNNQTESKD